MGRAPLGRGGSCSSCRTRRRSASTPGRRMRRRRGSGSGRRSWCASSLRSSAAAVPADAGVRSVAAAELVARHAPAWPAASAPTMTVGRGRPSTAVPPTALVAVDALELIGQAQRGLADGEHAACPAAGREDAFPQQHVAEADGQRARGEAAEGQEAQRVGGRRRPPPRWRRPRVVPIEASAGWRPGRSAASRAPSAPPSGRRPRAPLASTMRKRRMGLVSRYTMVPSSSSEPRAPVPKTRAMSGTTATDASAVEAALVHGSCRSRWPRPGP